MELEVDASTTVRLVKVQPLKRSLITTMPTQTACLTSESSPISTPTTASSFLSQPLKLCSATTTWITTASFLRLNSTPLMQAATKELCQLLLISFSDTTLTWVEP